MTGIWTMRAAGGFLELWECCLPRLGKCGSYYKAPSPRMTTQLSPPISLGPGVPHRRGLPTADPPQCCHSKRCPCNIIHVLIFFNNNKNLPKRYKSTTCCLQKCSGITEILTSKKKLNLTCNWWPTQCFYNALYRNWIKSQLLILITSDAAIWLRVVPPQMYCDTVSQPAHQSWHCSVVAPSCPLDRGACAALRGSPLRPRSRHLL